MLCSAGGRRLCLAGARLLAGTGTAAGRVCLPRLPAPPPSRAFSKMAVSINTLYEETDTPSKARTRAAERAGTGQERELLRRVEVKGVELETLIRKNGRIQSYDLRSLVERVEAAGSCSANHALLILRCCGAVLVDEDPAHRTRLVDYHFKRLQQLCSKFDISHYNTLMKVYLENHAGVSGSEMLSRVLRAGLQPNRVTYQHCLGLYCQAGDLAGALALQAYSLHKPRFT